MRDFMGHKGGWNGRRASAGVLQGPAGGQGSRAAGGVRGVTHSNNGGWLGHVVPLSFEQLHQGPNAARAGARGRWAVGLRGIHTNYIRDPAREHGYGNSWAGNSWSGRGPSNGEGDAVSIHCVLNTVAQQ